ncbi:MAG: Gfo/Idh/MocA family oxidoreductase [Candidatus Omnitrophica bacterium]|nr:Gfo/Idh/MocA family oxidoreductase [Candidatus Omnitrophota bacterium]
MKANSNLSRRVFIANSSILALGAPAASYARTMSSNDNIHVGLIGCGNRGSSLRMELLKEAEAAHVKITAVCDIWEAKRQAAARHVEDIQGHKPSQYIRYEDVLTQKDLHAVVIATPDHLHPIILRDAAKAALDAYVEKPLAIHFGDLCEAYDAVKANETVVQNGTQLRSLPSFTGCREFVRSGGLGSIIRIEQARNEYYPYWYQYRREIQENETDWNRFLAHAASRPWDPEVYTAWMGYRPFSNGAFGGYMTHFTDLVHYITGASAPRSVVSMSWKNQLKDNFTVPSCVQAVFDYPEGYSVSYHTTTGNGGANFFRAVGSKGILDMSDWNHPVVSGEGSLDPEAIQEKQEIPSTDHDSHMLDWLKCIRSRKQPNAGIEAGFAQALTAIMADEALLQNRRIAFDPQARQLKAI